MSIRISETKICHIKFITSCVKVANKQCVKVAFSTCFSKIAEEIMNINNNNGNQLIINAKSKLKLIKIKFKLNY